MANPILILIGLGAAYMFARKKEPPPIIGGNGLPDFSMYEEYGFSGPEDAMHAMGLLGFDSFEHMGEWMGKPVTGQLDEQILEWLQNGMDLYRGGAWETPAPMGG